jgi:hypothetical protein
MPAYVGWLSMQALRLEGSALNVAIYRRWQQAFPDQASFAVDRDLTEQGVFYQPNINTIGSYRLGLVGWRS